MTDIEELVIILKKQHPTEQDWKRFYELRQTLVDESLIRQVDNLLEIRYMEA